MHTDRHSANQSYSEILNWTSKNVNSGEVLIPNKLKQQGINAETSNQISTQRESTTLSKKYVQQFMSQDVIQTNQGIKTSNRARKPSLANDYPNMLNLIT